MTNQLDVANATYDSHVFVIDPSELVDSDGTVVDLDDYLDRVDAGLRAFRFDSVSTADMPRLELDRADSDSLELRLKESSQVLYEMLQSSGPL